MLPSLYIQTFQKDEELTLSGVCCTSISKSVHEKSLLLETDVRPVSKTTYENHNLLITQQFCA